MAAEAKVGYVFFVEPVRDRLLGLFTKEDLERRGVSGEWRGWEFDRGTEAKALELYRATLEDFNRDLRPIGEKYSPGGAASNTARLVAQFGLRPDVIIPHKLRPEDQDVIFGSQFGTHRLIPIGNAVPEGEVAQLTVDIFLRKGDGERRLLSLDNGKLKIPNKTQAEWMEWLGAQGFNSANSRFVIEGYILFSNIQSTKNLILAAQAMGIHTTFLLSNAYHLSQREKAGAVFELIRDGAISRAMGNINELAELLQTNGLLPEGLYAKYTKAAAGEELNNLELEICRIAAENSAFGGKTLIITRGPRSSIIIDDRIIGGMAGVPVPDLESRLIVSTNGAGDNCAGGILAALNGVALVNGRIPLEYLVYAVQFGHECAITTLQRESACFQTMYDFRESRLTERFRTIGAEPFVIPKPVVGSSVVKTRSNSVGFAKENVTTGVSPGPTTPTTTPDYAAGTPAAGGKVEEQFRKRSISNPFQVSSHM